MKTSGMFINFSLPKSHIMPICCLCLLHILVPSGTGGLIFPSFISKPLSPLGVHVVRVELPPLPAAGWVCLVQTAYPLAILDWFRDGRVTSSRPMRFGPGTSATTTEKEMCLFARIASLMVQKAGWGFQGPPGGWINLKAPEDKPVRRKAKLRNPDDAV